MEEWRAIPGYEGIYEASNIGRIRTSENKTTYTDKHGIRKWKQIILKFKGLNLRTGNRVSLWKAGKQKDYLVARLIAITFLRPPQNGDTVNHIDGNRLNNNANNLEWLSLADNIRHGFETGLYKNTCKPIVLINKNNKEMKTFYSLSKASTFLNKDKKYLSNLIKRGQELKDYEIVFLNQEGGIEREYIS